MLNKIYQRGTVETKIPEEVERSIIKGEAILRDKVIVQYKLYTWMPKNVKSR